MLGGTLEERSNLGLGCMSVSGQYDNGVPMSSEASLKFFKGVHDAGCTHFDTAEEYHSGPFNEAPGPGTIFNEAQLGEFFSTIPRGSFTVGTKYAPWRHEMRADYNSVKAALLASLQRLGVAYVDLYYSHRVLSREYAIEFVRSAARLKEEGLLRNIGLSEVSAEWLKAAHAVHPVCCIQQEWSLLTRGIEEELVPTCKQLGVGVVAYSPLARNLLAAPTVRPTDARRSSIPRFAEENFEKNKKMLDQLKQLAHSKGCSVAQLSMGWLLGKARSLGVQCLPIPGTKTLSHALENIASAELVLTQEEVALMERAAELSAGQRESEAYMQFGMEGATVRANAEIAAAQGQHHRSKM